MIRGEEKRKESAMNDKYIIRFEFLWSFDPLFPLKINQYELEFCIPIINFHMLCIEKEYSGWNECNVEVSSILRNCINFY